MKHLSQFLTVFKHLYMKLELLFNNPIGRVFLIPALTFPVLNSVQLALVILLMSFIADFLTGWLASYMEIKRGEKPMPPSGYAFESTRARESIVKAIGYIAVILGSVAIENLFLDRKFQIENLSTKQLGVTEIIIGFCAGIEMYSTIVENMKRAGFDIVGKAKTAISTVWDLIKKIKGE